MKTCTVCKETKDISEYHNNKRTKDGKAYRCKSCDASARKKWSDANPERASYSARNRRLKHIYGVDIEWYEAQMKAQNNKCAICETETNNTRGERKDWNFAVDHCHDTGKVRGLLCNQCNRALGLFKDDITLLEKAKNYLETH
jgi:hypothetical protein